MVSCCLKISKSKKSRIHVWSVRCVWSPQEPQRGSIHGQWIIWTCINKNSSLIFSIWNTLVTFWDRNPVPNQWDPSIISTEPTRTDGPSLGAIKSSQRRLYHSECVTRVFSALLSVQSRSRSHLWPLRPIFYQWDPSIISTKSTRTDGPSPRRDKIFAAAPLSLGMCHMRVFWVTLDSESV